MDIIDLHPLDLQVFDMGDLYLRCILHPAGSGKQTVPDGEVRPGDNRFEIVDGDLFQREAAVDSDIRLCEKIGLAVNNAVTGPEDHRFKMEWRGIDIVRRT